jgi:hypothetical protein
MSDTPLTDAVSKVPSEDQSTRGIAADWARFARSLERQLANLKQIQQDNIDSENDWRAAAGEWDESDSLCIESAATVIVRLRTQLAERDAMLAVSEHNANEWADAAVNGMQWLRNVRDGISDVGEAVADFESNITYCRGVPKPDSATARASAKIIAAAEEQERARDSWVDISSADLYLNACTATNQAVREKKELKP